MVMKTESELAFYEAVISGNAAGVEASLAAHPELIRWQDKDIVNKLDTTALHLNTRYLARGNREQAYAVFNILLRAGADVNIGDRTNWTPLMHAAINGEGGMLKGLLDAGANPFLTNDDGYNALMYAAQKGSIECVHMLLAQGVPVDARDNEGQTAMFKTRHAGDAAPAIIRFLIEWGADVDAKDSAGKTVVEVTVHERQFDTARLYSEIAIDVMRCQYRDKMVLKDGIPNALPVRRPLRLKNSPV